MDLDKQLADEEPKKKDGPGSKNGHSDDLPYRIKGLEESKTYPGMSPHDIAALDRSIAKLKLKLAEKNEPKPKEDGNN